MIDKTPARDDAKTRSDAPWFADSTAVGERGWHELIISESVAGRDIAIPVYVWKGHEPGPIVCVTAAVHGDEINGTGTIRSIVSDPPFDLLAGTLVMVPVVNLLGFERHSRYLPDRRDLNRSFPGSATGSLASRLAHAFFNQLTKHCDYGIDLHTAAVRRTNFPNVRADLSIPELRDFARAFGTELIIDSGGPKGSLRQAATKAGCPTIILEAGEVWKVESAVVEYTVRGITNCLRSLKMVEGTPSRPAYRLETDSSTWVRATAGGFLEFHVAPGEIVHDGEAIATSWDLGGAEVETIRAPRDGIVLGMTTIPSVAPGDPVVHLTYPKKGSLKKIEQVMENLDDDSLHERTREDLSRNFVVTDHDDEEE
ncbi:MAG: succinate dehydrogenase [Phycisphaerae bacterium]|nr:succinate dehydrogenase [Phycisphaerae bacterium]MBM90662.1 succinate dehydrogenase [Phycisphaerae bacterium]HCT44134.1 succinate dehydrogenase [Phycisphaerales bacterium]|tara:strand:+ start:30 stop:1136 length:1107 start_codon:yes stop_codon:yes gene_type:complete